MLGNHHPPFDRTGCYDSSPSPTPSPPPSSRFKWVVSNRRDTRLMTYRRAFSHLQLLQKGRNGPFENKPTMNFDFKRKRYSFGDAFLIKPCPRYLPRSSRGGGGIVITWSIKSARSGIRRFHPEAGNYPQPFTTSCALLCSLYLGRYAQLRSCTISAKV